MKTIYLVLPCYNEEAVLHEISARLKIKMNQLISENKILLMMGVKIILGVLLKNLKKVMNYLQGLNYQEIEAIKMLYQQD